MEMMKRLRFLLILVAMLSMYRCTNSHRQVEGEYVLELANEHVKKEISLYMAMIRERDNGNYGACDSVRFMISYMRGRDSINKIAVSPFVNPELLKSDPTFTMCNVDGEKCFYYDKSVYTDGSIHSMVRLTDCDYKELLANYFPLTYSHLNDEFPRVAFPMVAYEPEQLVLTLCKDSIVGKAYKRGLIATWK